MSWIVYFAKLISPNFFKVSKETNKLQFVTIAISHYCELARWALDIKFIHYKEFNAAPFQHVFPALALRLGDHNDINKKKSADPSKNKNPNDDVKKKTSVKKLTNVPVAITATGSILHDSWEIASYSGLKVIDDELKIFLDEIIGPLSRQLVYYYVLKPSNTNIWNRLCTENRSFFWKVLWFIGIGSYVKKLLSKSMKCYQVEAVNECKDQLRIAITKLDMIIEERAKRRNVDLIPNHINDIDIGDIAIASLVAPLVSPPNYCKGAFTSIFDQLQLQDKECQLNVNHWRNTISGQYTMSMYSKYRIA